MNAARRDLIGALDALIRAIDNADRIETVREGMVLENARRVLRRAKSGAIGPVPWTPFRPANWTPEATAAQIRLIADLAGCNEGRAREHVGRLAIDESIYVNSRYQVHVRDFKDGGVHLSVKRLDQGAIHDWRDLQRTKDDLLGPDCEAVELYPAAERMVDTSNQFHLWGVRDPKYRFPIGWNEGRLISSPDHGPAAQRPFEDREQTRGKRNPTKSDG